MWWDSYDSPGCWDELVADRRPRYACDGVVRLLGLLGKELAGGRRRPISLSARWGSPSLFIVKRPTSTSPGPST